MIQKDLYKIVSKIVEDMKPYGVFSYPITFDGDFLHNEITIEIKVVRIETGHPITNIPFTQNFQNHPVLLCSHILDGKVGDCNIVCNSIINFERSFAHNFIEDTWAYVSSKVFHEYEAGRLDDYTPEFEKVHKEVPYDIPYYCTQPNLKLYSERE